MGRLVSVLLAVLLVASFADARTPLRKCRKACQPLVSAVCPPKGKALRQCRTAIIKECRREGFAACALFLPTGGPGDGIAAPTTTTTTTLSPPPTTSTTVTSPVVTTTTLPPPVIPPVSGTWAFEGVLAQVACDHYDPVPNLALQLAVQQDGETLSGAVEDSAAIGAVDGSGWTFTWSGQDATCTQHLTVYASGYGSPTSARATASTTCDASTLPGALDRYPDSRPVTGAH